LGTRRVWVRAFYCTDHPERPDPATVATFPDGRSTTGAEIEKAIVNAMYHAFAEHRGVTMTDIYNAIGTTVPLSVTMKEQITKAKRCADNRAVRGN